MITRRQISVKVGYTYNLGNYSNIRPEIMISGEISDEDTTGGAIRHLQEQAIQACYRQIDEHLEKIGEPAEFSNEDRFSAHIFQKDTLCLLMPADVFEEYEQHYHSWNHRSLKGYRLDHLQALLLKRYPKYAIRDYDSVPPACDVPEQCFYFETDNAFFIGKGAWSDLPDYIRKYQVSHNQVERLWTAFYDEMLKKEADTGKACVVIADVKHHEELLTHGYAEVLRIRYEKEQAATQVPPEDLPVYEDDSEDEDDEAFDDAYDDEEDEYSDDEDE